MNILKLTSTAALISSAMIISGCGSDDGGSSSGIAPPANAIVIDSTNAITVATTAVDTASIMLAAKGTTTTTSPVSIINEALDRMHTTRKNAAAYDLVTGASFSETVSCADGTMVAAGSPNSFSVSIDGSDNGTSGSGSGTMSFVSCSMGSATIDGSMSINSSWNGANYTDQLTGKLTMTEGSLTISLTNMTYTETGSDYYDGGTGNFTVSKLQYVFNPGTDGFAVQLTTAIQGNEMNCGPTAGVVMVYGGNNSQARITFNNDMSMTVEYDTGNGTYTEISGGAIACII